MSAICLSFLASKNWMVPGSELFNTSKLALGSTTIPVGGGKEDSPG